jgi:hypothetical protein
VTLHNDPVIGWTITNPTDTLGRTYVGIRAQSIVAPDQVDSDPFSFTQTAPPPAAGQMVEAPLGYLDVGPGVFVRGNMFSEKNMVLGDDYLLQNTHPIGPAPNPTHPNGNLKLNSDLFLNGKIYTQVNGNWVDLGSYVQSQIPDVQFGTAHIDIGASSTSGSGLVTPRVSVTTKLPTYSKAVVQASVVAFSFVSQTAIQQFLAAAGPILGKPQVSVSASINTTMSTGQTAIIDVHWQVGPGYQNPINVFHYLIDSIDVSLVVVFSP